MRLKVTHMLMGVCVAAASVSCSNEPVDDGLRPAGDNDSEGISFVVADNNTRGGSFWNRPGSSTRATVTTPNNRNYKSFAVYGDMKSLDSSNQLLLFKDEEVKYNGTDWTYSKIRYWITDYEYSFVALYPKTIPGLSAIKYENSSLAFTYTLPENYKEIEDILTATHRRKSSSDNTGSVKFNLQHIMARLNFTVQVDKNSADGIVIDELSMTGVVNQASYQITPANLGTNPETDEYYDGNWTLTKQKAILFDKSFSGFGSFMPGETRQLFKADEDALMIIPQEVTNDITVYIKYHYSSEENDIKEGSAKLLSVSTSHNGVWNAGKSYNYTISLGGNDFVIFSTPEVSDWKPAEGGNYIITD